MLEVYLKRSGRLERVPDAGEIPAGTVWIDMLNPSPAEEALVEAGVGVDVPTAHVAALKADPRVTAVFTDDTAAAAGRVQVFVVGLHASGRVCTCVFHGIIVNAQYSIFVIVYCNE